MEHPTDNGTFTASEVKVFEMLTAIQTTQTFMLERLDKLTVAQGQQGKELADQRVICEGRRQTTEGLLLRVARLEGQAAQMQVLLDQARGTMRAFLFVGSVLTVLINVIALWFNHFHKL